MKKRYVLLAGLCVMLMAAAGCGKKDEPADAAPTPEPTIEVSGKGDMVEMQQSTGVDKTKITKIMGTKTASSSEVVITNNTGLEIESFYTRPAGEESWSQDYIQDKFTLEDKDQALFYYNSMEKDEDGNTITKYDLRVSYTDEEESDCMFRNLTLTDIEELKLNMEDGVPFVTYTSLSTKREVSTLEDAKARMGRSDDMDSDSSDEDSSDSGEDNSDDSNSNGNNSETGDSSSGEGDESGNSSSEPGDSGEPGDSSEPGVSDGRAAAEAGIGGSMDSLMGTIGGSDDSSYDVDPETGAQIGYYYYGDFTVSTTQDENGNEIVTGVW